MDWQVTELQIGVKLAAQCMLSKYNMLIHRLRTY